MKQVLHMLNIRTMMVAGLIVMGIAAAALEFHSGHIPDTFWYKTRLNASK